MCLALPMQVISGVAGQARCRGRYGEETIDTWLVGPVEPGQWLLCFMGAARELVDAERAAAIGAALDLLDAVAAGHDASDTLIKAGFPDLADREPQLPAHLRPAPAGGG